MVSNFIGVDSLLLVLGCGEEMNEGLVRILLNTEGQSGVIGNILNIDFLLIFFGF
jgi:hypothetical protein